MSWIEVTLLRNSALAIGCVLALGSAIQVISLGVALAQTAVAASDWTARLGELPARLRLIAATTGVGQLDRIPIGLEIELEPGFKTYWRTPGGPGLPTARCSIHQIVPVLTSAAWDRSAVLPMNDDVIVMTASGNG